MKNKKKGVLIAVVVIALIVAAVAAVCINKKAGDSGKLKEGQTETTVKKSDTKVITFAVPDICRIDENNLKQFNAALKMCIRDSLEGDATEILPQLEGQMCIRDNIRVNGSISLRRS